MSPEYGPLGSLEVMVPIASAGINTTTILRSILYPFDASSWCQEFIARGLCEMLPVGSRRRRAGIRSLCPIGNQQYWDDV